MLTKLATGLIATLAVSAMPAMANETATTTQMSGVIDTQAVSGLDNEQFSELFAGWEALEEGAKVDARGNLVAGFLGGNAAVPSQMPLEGARLSSGYGMRDHPILRQRRNHNGVDLAAPSGTPVYATADGFVGKAQWWGSYGNYVQIEHGGEMQTRYAHLSSYTVSSGERVRKGELIGYVGTTGRSTGPHLHYEVRIANEPVDPRPYMLAELTVDDDASAGRGGPE